MVDWNERLNVSIGDYTEDESSFVATSGKREDFVDFLGALHKAGYDGFCITMPCGYEQRFLYNGDLPREDLLCSCGKEYLIKITG